MVFRDVELGLRRDRSRGTRDFFNRFVIEEGGFSSRIIEGSFEGFGERHGARSKDDPVEIIFRECLFDFLNDFEARIVTAGKDMGDCRRLDAELSGEI